jgi:origin recognition complex subunit 6
MNRTIEQALLSLLPTHNAALPPALVQLASSLLAQSRHRASTLKAEEEVARPYACAHMACDRFGPFPARSAVRGTLQEAA